MSRHLCRCLMVVLLFAMPALADDAPAKAKSVADLIKQLDAEKAEDRDAASKELIAKGEEAIPALIEATRSKSAEVATRSLDILRKQLNSSDLKLRLSAVTAIKKLSQVPQPLPAPPPMDPPEVAIANELLKSVTANSSSTTTNFLVRLAGGVKGTGRGSGGGMLTYSFADGSRVSIHGEDNQAIMVTLSEKQDGKTITKEFVALSVSELKEKYPDAFLVYEAAIQMRESYAGSSPWGSNPISRFDPSQRRTSPDSIRRLALDQKMREQTKVITQRLNDATAKVKKATETGKTDGLLEALEAVEQARKNLQELENTIPTGK